MEEDFYEIISTDHFSRRGKALADDFFWDQCVEFCGAVTLTPDFIPAEGGVSPMKSPSLDSLLTPSVQTMYSAEGIIIKIKFIPVSENLEKRDHLNHLLSFMVASRSLSELHACINTYIHTVIHPEFPES